MQLILTEKRQREYNRLRGKYCAALKKTDAESAVSYLESRGVSQDLISMFEIGWHPKSVDLKYRSKFKGRVIFPITDEFGDTVAFSGRYPFAKFPNGKPDDDEFWWHEVFPKSFHLYGMSQSWSSILKRDFVIIVEGQCDVVMCHKFGLVNTVGTLGTALTEYHIAKLARYTSNFVCMFDGDAAGRKAWEHSEKMIGNKVDFRCINVPLRVKNVEYDPDSFLREYGPSAIVDHIGKNLGREFVVGMGKTD